MSYTVCQALRNALLPGIQASLACICGPQGRLKPFSTSFGMVNPGWTWTGLLHSAASRAALGVPMGLEIGLHNPEPPGHRRRWNNRVLLLPWLLECDFSFRARMCRPWCAPHALENLGLPLVCRRAALQGAAGDEVAMRIG